MNLEFWLLTILFIIYLVHCSSKPSWRGAVSLIIIIALLICNLADAYPSQESRERASEKFAAGGRALGTGALESLPLLLEPAGPVGIAVGGAAVGHALYEAGVHTMNGLNTLRDKENDIMSSQGHMLWSMENNMHEYDPGDHRD